MIDLATAIELVERTAAALPPRANCIAFASVPVARGSACI